jgi:hypothetical protein
MSRAEGISEFELEEGTRENSEDELLTPQKEP